MELSKKEKRFIKRIMANMTFYKKYKKLMGKIGGVYITDGREAAKDVIRENIDEIIDMALSEAYLELFK